MAIIFPFLPNWSKPFTKTLTFKTEVLKTRDRTEQRLAGRKHPRTALSFTPNPTRTDVAKTAALLFKDIQGEVVVPEYPVSVRVASDRASGFDSVVVSGDVPFWAAPGLWVVLESSEGQEAFQVASVAGSAITISGLLMGNVRAGSKVYPGIVGRLEQNSKVSMMTSRAAAWSVDFAADPGPRNYRLQGTPDFVSGADGRIHNVTTPISGGRTYFSLADLNLTIEDVDSGLIVFSVVVTSTFKDVDLNDMDGFLSADVRVYRGTEGFVGPMIPGGSFTDSKTVSGQGTVSLNFNLPVGTRHIGLDPDVISVIPFYTLAIYSVRNSFYKLPTLEDGNQRYYKETMIFPVKPNWAGGVSLSVAGNLETVDFDFGLVENYSFLDWNAVATQVQYTRVDSAKIARIVNLFTTVRGQQGEFYTPTWVEDFDVSTGAAQGVKTLQSPGIDLYQAYAGSEFHRDVIVFWRDGTYQVNPLVSLMASSGHTTSTFANVWNHPVNTGTVYMMCWLVRCRLMVDTLEIEYLTDDKAEMQLTYIPVKEPDA